MTSAQAGQVPVTTYGQQSGERRLDHPAGRLIGAQPFERSLAQTFPVRFRYSTCTTTTGLTH